MDLQDAAKRYWQASRDMDAARRDLYAAIRESTLSLRQKSGVVGISFQRIHQIERMLAHPEEALGFPELPAQKWEPDSLRKEFLSIGADGFDGTNWEAR